MTDYTQDPGDARLDTLESRIAGTRAALDRKLDEIGRRIQPDEVREELKDALKRRLDVSPYLGWIATSLVATGSVMAWRGWRSRSRPHDARLAGVYCEMIAS